MIKGDFQRANPGAAHCAEWLLFYFKKIKDAFEDVFFEPYKGFKNIKGAREQIEVFLL